MLPQTEALPLRLVTPKARLRVHSQLGALPWFRERDERALWMHPRRRRRARPRRRRARRGAQRPGPGALPVPRDRRTSCPASCRSRPASSPSFDDAGRDVAGAANVLTSDEPTLPSRGATMSCVAVEVGPAGPGRLKAAGARV